MSYRVLVEVRCDHVDEQGFQCTNTTLFQRTNSGGMNKRMAGIFARHEGWWTSGGQHLGYADPKKAYCPKHRALHERKT